MNKNKLIFILGIVLFFLNTSCKSTQNVVDDGIDREKYKKESLDESNPNFSPGIAQNMQWMKDFYESNLYNPIKIEGYKYKGKIKTEIRKDKIYFFYKDLIIDADYKYGIVELLKSGVLDEALVYNSERNVSIYETQEAVYLENIPTKRRYSILLTFNNEDGITQLVVELENKKANTGTNLKEFLKNAKLTKFIMFVWI